MEREISVVALTVWMEHGAVRCAARVTRSAWTRMATRWIGRAGRLTALSRGDGRPRKVPQPPAHLGGVNEAGTRADTNAAGKVRPAPSARRVRS